ncbi:MAG: FG-GAP-like repeat-containing protein [Myxococcota bacterium]
MTTRIGLNVAAWNLALLAVTATACQEPPTSANDDVDTGSSTSSTSADEEATSTGSSTSETTGCEPEGCDASSSTSTTDAPGDDDGGDGGDTTGAFNDCFSDEDCAPGSLCESFDGGDSTVPDVDCVSEDIYGIEPCAALDMVHALPLPSLGHPAISLSFVDIDGDGLDDVIAGHEEGAAVLFGPGDAGFEPLPLSPGPIISTAAGDFDGDGLGDIAALSEAGELTIVRGTAEGGWNPLPGPDAAGVDQIYALDFTGDDTDLALFEIEESRVSFWRSAGGEFSLFRIQASVERPVRVGPSSVAGVESDAFFYAGYDDIQELYGHEETQWYADRNSRGMSASMLDLGPDRPRERVLTSYHVDWTLIHLRDWTDTHHDIFHFLPYVAQNPQTVDFDGDGRDELVLETGSGLVLLPAAVEGPRIGCGLEYEFATDGPWALGDLDGDGRTEYVAASGDGFVHRQLPEGSLLTPR